MRRRTVATQLTLKAVASLGAGVRGGHLRVGAAACSHELVGITGLFDDVSVVL